MSDITPDDISVLAARIDELKKAFAEHASLLQEHIGLLRKENDLLQKENDLLRAENDLLRRRKPPGSVHIVSDADERLQALKGANNFW